jgi:3-polyprenyl-4-hydroxybenzoate decarboxylase
MNAEYARDLSAALSSSSAGMPKTKIRPCSRITSALSGLSAISMRLTRLRSK